MRAHHKPTFGVEIARASDKLIAHERQLLADCEDATELVGLPEKGYSPASKLRAVIAGGCNPVKLRREEYRADRAQPDLRRANGKGETAKTLIAPLAGLRNSSTSKLNTARGPLQIATRSECRDRCLRVPATKRSAASSTRIDRLLDGNTFDGFGRIRDATAKPLTPDAFGDPHFCPKQVCAGALSAGCQ
jgi:hypothetical protein